MTHISQFKAFDGLTEDEHQIIIGGWVNDVNPEDISEDLKISFLLVKAYYGVQNLMLYEADCMSEDGKG